MTRTYIIKDGKPVLCQDFLEFAQWFEKNRDLYRMHTTIGEVLISTVFLGFDHNYYSNSEPILWETMVFDNRAVEFPLDDFLERYTSIEAAREGHKQMVNKVHDLIK